MRTRHIALASVRASLAAALALILFPAAALAQSAEPDRSSVSPLLGEWHATRIEVEGRNVDLGRMPKPVLTFKADGTAGGSDGMGATWTVDDARSPARLDFIHVVGRDAGKTQHCVYAVTGDTLTIVFSVPGQGVDGAPVRLDSSHKPMLMLMVLERASRDLR